jgi:hypothetical protein
MPAPAGYAEVDPNSAPTLSLIPNGYSEVKPVDIPTPAGGGTGNKGIDAFVKGMTTDSPLNPANWLEMLKNASPTSAGWKPEDWDNAQKLIDAAEKRDSLLPFMTGKEDGTMGEFVGQQAAFAGNAALLAGTAHVLHKGFSAGMKADPVKDLIPIYHPSDPRFIERAPQALSDIRENTPLDANGNHVIITSNEHLASTSPTEVVRPALKANRDAMDAYHNPVQAKGIIADPSSILQATWDSLKEMTDPQKRLDIYNAEKAKLLQSPLDANRMKALLEEKNGELNAFYSRSPEVQAAAQQAGATTGRSQATLYAQKKQIANTYYNMLDPNNNGDGPREIQHRYGAMKMIQGEASDGTTRNNIAAETGGSNIGKLTRSVSALPDALVSPLKPQGTVEGVKAIKTPFTGKSNPMIARAFRNAPDYQPLPVAPLIDERYPAPNRSRALPASPVPFAMPGVTGRAGEPGWEAPLRAEQDPSFVRGVPGIGQPPNPNLALPPATTRFSGETGEDFHRGVVDRPTDTWSTPHSADPIINARDALAIKHMGRAFSQLSSFERTTIEKIRTGVGLNISELSSLHH